jgi:hypothetical protein
MQSYREALSKGKKSALAFKIKTAPARANLIAQQ